MHTCKHTRTCAHVHICVHTSTPTAFLVHNATPHLQKKRVRRRKKEPGCLCSCRQLWRVHQHLHTLTPAPLPLPAKQAAHTTQAGATGGLQGMTGKGGAAAVITAAVVPRTTLPRVLHAMVHAAQPLLLSLLTNFQACLSLRQVLTFGSTVKRP
jgi:hypothetical protein